MEKILEQTSLACLHRDHGKLLAPLRCHPSVQVGCKEEKLWLRWDEGNGQVVQALLPIPGIQFFGKQDPYWYPAGQSLPAFTIPQLEWRSLDQLLLPERIATVPASQGNFEKVPFGLRPANRNQPTRSGLYPLPSFRGWVEQMPTSVISSLRGVYSEQKIFVIGDQLPLLSGCQRFWGQDVFVPVGFDLEPSLPAGALRDALGLKPREILLVLDQHLEIINAETIQPLSRAGVRLAERNRKP